MKTLVLGTYPPHEDQRDFPFYYPNNVNHFWKILAEIANQPLKEWKLAPAVQERKALMTKLLVGVQNVGRVIERVDKSALDQNITILEYQDILKIFSENPSLRKILLTGYSGRTSTYRSFVTYLKLNGIEYSKPEAIKAGHEFTIYWERPLTCVLGNSTSPTARRSGVTFEKLVAQFRQAMNEPRD